MKIRTIWLVIPLLVIGLSSCSNNSPGNDKGGKLTVMVAGSTSVMPFSEKLAEHFRVERPSIRVDVQGGGSSAGIQACLNKTVDIGMSSRDLKGEEKVLKEIPICHDGIAFVVHPRNPLKDISLEEVRAIYNGKIKNWKELGWIDRNIDGVTREEGSGTRGSFEDLVMGKSEIHDSIMVQDSNGSVKEVVATDPYAIGYISLGVVDSTVRALSVGGISPTTKNILGKKVFIGKAFSLSDIGRAERGRPYLYRFRSVEARTADPEK